MAKHNTKTRAAKGSTPVAAPKPEPKAASPKTPVVAITPEAPPVEAKAKTAVAGTFLSRDQFDIGDGKGSRRVRVAEFQDYTFNVNDDPKRQFTDEELCAVWKAQFPGAIHGTGAFLPFHVRGARRDFNMGRHSRTFNTPRTGDNLSHAYFDVEGKRVRADHMPKVVKPKATPEPPKAEPVAETPAAKPTVRVKKHGSKRAA